MTHLKILTALTALALLTACAGGVTNNIGEININNGELCDTNPYGADCGEEFETERQTIAEDCRTNGEGEFCADAIKSVCPTNVDDTLCDGIKEYVDQRTGVVEQCTDTKTQEACDEEDRITACDDNEFATTCPEQKYIDKRRMTCLGEKTSDRCKPTVALICGADGDIFDDFCTGLPTTGAMRTAACQTHGTGAMGDASCDTVIHTDCVANPFMHLGCATLDDAIRDNFCAKEANIFTHEDCGKLGNIGDLRMTYCSVTDIFHESCLDDTNGGKTERDNTCQMHGTGAMGDASCRARIIGDCMADPFDYTGCDSLGDLKTTFCTTTKIFDDNCLDGMNGGDSARALACQTHGITPPMGDASCRARIISDCTANPFGHTGCATLNDYSGTLVPNFCGNTSDNDGQNPFNGMCDVNEGKRKTACLAHGLAASSTLCDGIIRPDCVMKPFDNAGCATLGDYSSSLVPTFCRDTNTDTGKKSVSRHV